MWGPGSADMQLISKFNKEFQFLLCDTYIYSKYVWVVALNNEKGITGTKAFQEIIDKTGRKPNRIWSDKGSGF